LIAAVIAYVAGITAVRLLCSRLASFVGLAEVLFAVVFAWLLLEQRLDATQLAGGALVVAGIALVRLDEMRHPAPVDAGEKVAGAQAVACDPVATGV
jgi:drug/metabolite transporter (DMT)-like permease